MVSFLFSVIRDDRFGIFSELRKRERRWGDLNPDGKLP